ncbi:28S ribosomal protein S29, mitochondrial [Hypsibius exemplaris]|uniref:Small ribosomal subunit protein mS29 n=1 Tax=Hypsibius exemplaris TaxID=2072580 RepID=A0A1W0X4A4_HYPEX|nr:28S ribosomal protein S29, mitochondrial [Hypsibius exemplaris]
MPSSIFSHCRQVGRLRKLCSTAIRPPHGPVSRPFSMTAAMQQKPQQMLRSQRVIASELVQKAEEKSEPSSSSAASTSEEVPMELPRVQARRTSQQNPADHTMDVEGFFYTVPPAVVEPLFGWTRPVSNTRGAAGATDMRSRTLQYLHEQGLTLREYALMIRQPALEVMDYIKKSDLSLPAVRYVLYGRHGSGKTASLAHILHFFAANDWLIVHMPRVTYYNRHYKEVADSTFHPGRIDLPVCSVEWLQHFLSQNSAILKDPSRKLLTHKTYVWSKREETPAGSPLLDIVELGIKRGRYANDAIGVLMRELKLLAPETGQKVGVVVDVVNALFSPTLIPRVNKTTVPAEVLSLYCHFRSIVRNDWTNGAIVTSVDRRNVTGEVHDHDGGGNYLPRYLLRGPGWEWMDPCIPVHVKDYQDKELTNCLDYYMETRWLQHENAGTQKGRDELKFVSGMNPGVLRSLVSRL